MIILASSSPRRKEILQKLIKEFSVIPSNFDESKIKIPSNKKATPALLASCKATDVAISYPKDIVIGSDTIVLINNEILGKPKDKEDASRMLKLLSGKVHQVITAVTIVKDHKTYSFTDIAKVKFKKLTEDEIYEYTLTEEPYDKAGAYAVQSAGKKFIKKIKGDYYTVMGLPYDKLAKELQILGII